MTDASTAPAAWPHTDHVAQWRPSGALDALRELLMVGEKVPASVAREAELSHSELRALELLVDAPRGPVELSHHLGVTSAASSGIVDRLCARGHAERVPHPSDGRRTQVVITDSAREEVLGHLMPMFLRLQELDAQFTPEELEVVERYLRAATEAIKVMVR